MIGLHVINTDTGKPGIITKQLKNGNYRISGCETQQFRPWSQKPGDPLHLMSASRSAWSFVSYFEICERSIDSALRKEETSCLTTIKHGGAESLDALARQIDLYRDKLHEIRSKLLVLAEENRKMQEIKL